MEINVTRQLVKPLRIENQNVNQEYLASLMKKHRCDMAATKVRFLREIPLTYLQRIAGSPIACKNFSFGPPKTTAVRTPV